MDCLKNPHFNGLNTVARPLQNMTSMIKSYDLQAMRFPKLPRPLVTVTIDMQSSSSGYFSRSEISFSKCVAVGQ